MTVLLVLFLWLGWSEPISGVGEGWLRNWKWLIQHFLYLAYFFGELKCLQNLHTKSSHISGLYKSVTITTMIYCLLMNTHENISYFCCKIITKFLFAVWHNISSISKKIITAAGISNFFLRNIPHFISHKICSHILYIVQNADFFPWWMCCFASCTRLNGCFLLGLIEDMPLTCSAVNWFVEATGSLVGSCYGSMVVQWWFFYLVTFALTCLACLCTWMVTQFCSSWCIYNIKKYRQQIGI